MLWTTYTAIRCNGCNGLYYVDNGDPGDCTALDVDAVKCPWCGVVELMIDDDPWFDGEDDEDEDDREDPADYAEVGKKSLPESPPPKVDP